MRAAIYVRVSTEEQAENTSIPNQIQRVRAYIAAQGWEHVATFIEPGGSGKILERSALSEARQAALRGEIDILLIYRMGRLSRDIDDLFLLRREFKSIDITIWAVQEGLDITTNDTDILLSVLFEGYFGHREREVILRRMREGVEAKVRSGQFCGGPPPYGYRRDDDDYLIIYEPQARIMRKIYCYSGEKKESSYQIADRLNAMGIKGPGGGMWYPNVVNRLLKRTLYSGTWHYGQKGSTMPEIMVPVPAIVDEELWEKAQRTIAHNRRRGRGRKAKHNYLLRGLMRCECGYSYTTYSMRNGHGYRCTARYAYKRLKTDKCYSVTVRGEEIEEAVWSDIEHFIRQPELVIAELRDRREPIGEDIAEQLAGVDKALSDRKSELERCLALYLKDSIPEDILDKKAQEIRGHISALEGYRAQLLDDQKRADAWESQMITIVEALQAHQNRLDADLAFDERRELVELLVKEIVIETHVDDEEEKYPIAHVTYRFEQPKSETPIPIEALIDGWSEIDTGSFEVKLTASQK